MIDKLAKNHEEKLQSLLKDLEAKTSSIGIQSQGRDEEVSGTDIEQVSGKAESKFLRRCEWRTERIQNCKESFPQSFSLRALENPLVPQR